ncbi:hypothetical protein ACFODK_05100 [Altererythrobacter lauratis]|uniref:JmjC domain-containing protein n=2 Tax=Alteraurantiacibacter lauratis TaxID=2054627 RepID=A0ABV7EE95_9SPHN
MHLAAVMAMREVGKTPWYDAHFLCFYEAAKVYLAKVRPDAIDSFVEGFAPLHTPRDFQVREVEALFSEAELEPIRTVVRDLSSRELERHELEHFGRHVVHDHPYFVDLQLQLTALVSELAGQELEPGYNFLSLYGNMGRCGLHMDQPVSMYTLDICIEQDVEWPIWFSELVDWPDREILANFDEEAIKRQLRFTPYVLKPGNAILFSGSSQWHYRDAMPRPGFCHLLFFHYFPKGCLDLVESSNWPRLFDIPELEALIDVFRQTYPDAVDFKPSFA